MIWKSFNVKDCKVTLMNGQRIMLDFTSMEGYDSTNIFDAKRHVEKAADSEDVEAQEVPAPMGRDRAKKKGSSSGARSETSIAGRGVQNRKDLKHNPSRLNLKWCRRAAFYEFIEEDSEYSNDDDDSQEDYDFDQNSRSQRRLSAQF
ncbi:hypothetical protein Tco_1539988 [Tanacetum coccineum]